MTKKNSHSDQEELWSRSFDDEDFTEVPYSRSAKKKAEKHISPVTKTILIFGILLLILPTGAYFWWLNEEGNMPDSDANNANDTQVLVTQNDSSNDSSEVDSTSEDEESAEEEDVAEEPEKQEEQPEEDTEPVEDPVEEETETTTETNQNTSTEQPKVEEKPQSEPVSTPESSGNTYTVKAGDNLFRIALNHNMTTEELKALNGITGDEISVGKVLKVK